MIQYENAKSLMQKLLKPIVFLFLISLSVAYSSGSTPKRTSSANTKMAHPLKVAMHKPSSSQVVATPVVSNTRILTLENAVLLALHSNPDLIMAFNARKVSRYDWLDKKRIFHPKFSLSGSSSYSKDTSSSGISNIQKTASIGPKVIWKLPLGTSITGSVGYTPNKLNSTGGQREWSVDITQPLLQGAGNAFNEIDLNEAKDDQIKADYTLKTTLMSTISTTISDYYTILSAKLSLKVASETLKQNQKEEFNREELFKAGRKAQSDVDQSKQTVKTQQQAVQKAELALNLAKITLLDNDLGLPENTDFDVVNAVKVDPIHPTLANTSTLAKKHNITYLTALIALKESKYALIQDRNAMEWQLGLTLHHGRTTQFGSNNASPGQLYTSSSASLNLSIPLDTVSRASQRIKLATDESNAKLTYQKAQLSLQSSVRQTLVSLNSDWQGLQLAKENLTVTQRATQAAKIKFQYNKLDALTLAQQQQTLVQAKNSIITSEITYLNDKVKYQALVGSLLNDWHIKIKDQQHG